MAVSAAAGRSTGSLGLKLCLFVAGQLRRADEVFECDRRLRRVVVTQLILDDW
jgi:hypothetical protein